VHARAHGKSLTGARLARAGYDSTHGIGTRAPAFVETDRRGRVWPTGPLAPAAAHASELDHSEYVVYEPTRARIRYVVLVDTLPEAPREREASE